MVRYMGATRGVATGAATGAATAAIWVWIRVAEDYGYGYGYRCVYQGCIYVYMTRPPRGRELVHRGQLEDEV